MSPHDLREATMTAVKEGILSLQDMQAKDPNRHIATWPALRGIARVLLKGN